jgi:hypothetical protein
MNNSVLPDIIYKNIDKKILNGYNLPLKKIPEELNKKYYIINFNGKKSYTVEFKDNSIYIYKNKLIYTTDSVYYYDLNDNPIDIKIINNYIKKYRPIIKQDNCLHPEYDWSHNRCYICVKLVKKIKKFNSLFIGVDPKNTNNLGNTILIGLTSKKYLYICENVVELNVLEPILEYYSPIGNSDVPYPIAFTKTNIILLNTNQKYKSTKYLINIINKNKLEKLWKNSNMQLLIKDYIKDKTSSVLDVYYQILYGYEYKSEYDTEYKFMENLNKFIYDNKIKFKNEKQNLIDKPYKQIHLLV